CRWRCSRRTKRRRRLSENTRKGRSAAACSGARLAPCARSSNEWPQTWIHRRKFSSRAAICGSLSSNSATRRVLCPTWCSLASPSPPSAGKVGWAGPPRPLLLAGIVHRTESHMPTSAGRVLKLCRALKGFEARENLALADYVNAIPRLNSFGDVPAGTPVLVRGDVDCKPGPQVGQVDIRLRSMQTTLEFGRSRGWKQIVVGHLGRKQKDKPIGSLAKVAARLGQILGCDVPLIEDWLDEPTNSIKRHV